jgi:hypothetical protein
VGGGPFANAKEGSKLAIEFQATARFALTNPAFQTAPHLVREILQEQGVLGALEPDMQLTDPRSAEPRIILAPEA